MSALLINGTVYVKVMTAASYWSLLEPAIETASLSGLYGEDGQYAFIPVSFGFAAGAAFVYVADYSLTKMVLHFRLVMLNSLLFFQIRTLFVKFEFYSNFV